MNLTSNSSSSSPHPTSARRPFGWLRALRLGRNREHADLEKALAEAISDDDANASPAEQTAAQHQRLLLENVLELKNLTAFDVMVPRADIVAIDISTPPETVMQMLSSRQYSRLPVYRETLDDVIGTIHIKDILARVVSGQSFHVTELVRDVPVISPAMHVLDLLLMMRNTKKHMALVVDEFGGIDGLVTINDIVETIVGEIDDEYQSDQQPQIVDRGDGTWLVDGRYDLEDFEELFDFAFSENDHAASDTMAGLVVSIAGRVPGRGEVIQHPSGIEFEVVEADPRRVNRLRLRNIPVTHAPTENDAHP